MHGCCADKPYGKGCTKGTCMQLPAGKTCGDCAHCGRCCALFGHKPSDDYCDWFPRCFLDARGLVTKAGRDTTGGT